DCVSAGAIDTEVEVASVGWELVVDVVGATTDVELSDTTDLESTGVTRLPSANSRALESLDVQPEKRTSSATVAEAMRPCGPTGRDGGR
ncbi:MAG: hypothetical protein ABMA25_12455, partial [Ilumatobacteraceae bacterium]